MGVLFVATISRILPLSTQKIPPFPLSSRQAVLLTPAGVLRGLKKFGGGKGLEERRIVPMPSVLNLLNPFKGIVNRTRFKVD